MQPSLFDLPSGFDVRVPAARRSRTSQRAAERLVRVARQGTKARTLLLAYQAVGVRGLTDSEARAATGLPRQSICSLRWNLVRFGYVAQTANEREGEYRGFDQAVYRITPKGAKHCCA